jgi:Fe-S-cluster containining protein
MSVPGDCRRCGACCFSAAERYVVVTGNDWSRLGPETDRLAHFVEHRAFMKMTDGHCAALAVRRASDGPPDFFCTVYDRRPQICRDLERGSPQCEAERAMKPEPSRANSALP